MRIGILALQGAFVEHAAMLDRLGAEHFEIRQHRDIDHSFDGLILPGGESTVMRKLLHDLDLFAPLQRQIRDGLPVFGTCAGLILLAKSVEGGAPCFATMDISVLRNAYGRQLGSFYAEDNMEGVGKVPMTFIRAPYIRSVSASARVLAEKLFVSDKAVSKWERGLSLPDVSLLIPLAETLGVTVAELLEGRSLDTGAELDAEQVDKLVKKAITLSGDSPEKNKQKQRKAALIFTVCAAAAFAEMLLILRSGRLDSTLLTLVLMSFGFGIYFWFPVKDRLPAYYDENKISAYSSGPIRMNIPGLHFNNSNWPHILRALRIWTAASMIGLPFLFQLLSSLAPGLSDTLSAKMVLLFLYLGGLFIPLYIAGRKYG